MVLWHLLYDLYVFLNDVLVIFLGDLSAFVGYSQFFDNFESLR